MRLEEQLKDLQPLPCVAVVGTFDGVHRGHSALLKIVTEKGAKERLKTRAFVFVRQPRETIRPDLPALYLSEFDERVRLITEVGVSEIVPLEFNAQMQAMSAKEFLQMLRDCASLAFLVIGENARMGSDLADSAQIKRIAESLRVNVLIVAAQTIKSSGGELASSTVVRRNLASGDVKAAAKTLERLYALTGVVVKGKGRGKNLGYPTANLELRENLLVPLEGIYATIAVINGKRFKSATSIGVRPTFGDTKRTIETHVINYRGDLYGQNLRIEFFERLRDEKRFDIPDMLIAQIQEDVVLAERMLERIL